MGAWFPKHRGGGIFNLWGQWGKSKCQWKNPSNCELPFLSHSPNHLILLEIGWVSYCMRMGKVWKLEIWIWGKPIFGEKHFLLLGQVNTQNACPFGHTPTSWRSGSLRVVLPSLFCSFSSSCMPKKSVLVLFSKWARNIFILGVYGSHLVPVMP